MLRRKSTIQADTMLVYLSLLDNAIFLMLSELENILVPAWNYSFTLFFR